MLVNTYIRIYKKTLIFVVGFLILLLSAYTIGATIGSEEYGFLPLALVCGLFGAFLVLKKPLIGLALMFFLVPLGPVTRLIGAERAITLAVGVLLLGTYGTRVLILHEKIKFDRVSQLAFAFVGWGAITSLWAYEPKPSIEYALRLTQMVAMYILVLNYCRSQRHLDILTLSLAAGAAVAAMVTILIGVNYHGGGRLTLSKDFNPNSFSGILSISIPIIFYHLYKSKYALLKNILILTILPVGYSIIEAGSRGVWLALPASLLISIILVARNLKYIRNFTIAVTILIGVVASAYYTGMINENVIKRYETLFSSNAFSVTAGRSDIWKVGLEMVKDSFPFGVGGFVNFGIAYPHYAAAANSSYYPQADVDAHNTFLGVLVETGLVGFVLFMGIFIHLFKRILCIRDRVTRLVQMWLLSLIVLISLTGSNQYTPWFWFVLVLIALAASFNKQINQKVFSR